ncbi:hypothetical protein EYZ11_010018 [Aspergillus tanneri]|uniref:urease n=1 Tax=Aspergillus tanneri TaxID=1220188 RepID=A0A4S3J6N8_9EURO|nr:uncharacterized protein ATNIH1004_006641 [Aspergillus tanneri]KAA8645222.1 hypothetical protein ATNIH1004_006641 [Aspergillus tanneri]THC90515.1 hypothetical protein EYZ11_010018 [Aspergillus tanneri]
MHLIPRELERLASLYPLGNLAQRRLSRGVRLNHPEAVLIRDGHYAVADLMSIGRKILGRRHVLPSTWFTARQIQVEGTFPTGTYLVTVVDPIATEGGNIELALYGTGLTAPPDSLFPEVRFSDFAPEKAPGYIWCKVSDCPNDPDKTDILLNEKRDRRRLKVINKGSRPIQVGSHYHFIETNRKLCFNRKEANGYRLDTPSGSSIRFEPGQCRMVDLVQIAGRKRIAGGNGVAKYLHENHRIPDGFENDGPAAEKGREDRRMQRHEYVKMFGPTKGDVVRLGSTDLYVMVEEDCRDRTGHCGEDCPDGNGDCDQVCRVAGKCPKCRTYYGDECNFGGGKSVRDGMAQTSYGSSKEHSDSQNRHENSDPPHYVCVDTVITNALIIDYTGIIKADIGIKNGHITAIGRAGNPDIMDDVDIVIGANTDVIGAENKIVTAGGIDTHVHILDPAQVPEALCNGLTTLVGGGTGPSTASNATTCTSGPENIKRMLQAFDHLPINVGITGKGNNSDPEGLNEQVEAGAIGLKLHEDWGATHVAIDTCLEVCEKYDVQSTLHTDTMNEGGYVQDTINSIDNRTIHSYHTEGAGGGHAPDIIAVVATENILPASTNPTRPYTFNTVDEHLDMVMVAHHLSKEIPADVAFAESRIRAETIAAEDQLLDNGSISIMSSDTQAMGRVGEVVLRSWTSAHKMAVLDHAPPKTQKRVGSKDQLYDHINQFCDADNPLCHDRKYQTELPDDAPTINNFRVKRYISKYTINPAIAHGMSHLIGSVEKDKFADLVIWQPSNFGTKPDMVLKGGMIAVALGGDPNGSIPTIEPRIMRPRFATFVPQTSITFVSQASVAESTPNKDLDEIIEVPEDPTKPFDVPENSKIGGYNLKKRVEPVKGCRRVKKEGMIFNGERPEIDVDPETFVVKAGGHVCDVPPATSVSLAQDYFIC